MTRNQLKTLLNIVNHVENANGYECEQLCQQGFLDETCMMGGPAVRANNSKLYKPTDKADVFLDAACNMADNMRWVA